MRKIIKYPIPSIDGIHTISVPIGSRLIHVHRGQQNLIAVFVDAPSDQAAGFYAVALRVVSTGAEFTDDASYVGTVSQPIAHVYRLTD